MMYIVYKGDRVDSGKEFQWHVGSGPFPKNSREVDMVQADGDELDEIYAQNIGGIHMAPHNRVVKWYGDDARFIVGNLKTDVQMRG